MLSGLQTDMKGNLRMIEQQFNNLTQEKDGNEIDHECISIE